MEQCGDTKSERTGRRRGGRDGEGNEEKCSDARATGFLPLSPLARSRESRDSYNFKFPLATIIRSLLLFLLLLLFYLLTCHSLPSLSVALSTHRGIVSNAALGARMPHPLVEKREHLAPSTRYARARARDKEGLSQSPRSDTDTTLIRGSVDFVDKVPSPLSRPFNRPGDDVNIVCEKTKNA